MSFMGAGASSISAHNIAPSQPIPVHPATRFRKNIALRLRLPFDLAMMKGKKYTASTMMNAKNDGSIIYLLIIVRDYI